MLLCIKFFTSILIPLWSFNVIPFFPATFSKCPIWGTALVYVPPRVLGTTHGQRSYIPGTPRTSASARKDFCGRPGPMREHSLVAVAAGGLARSAFTESRGLSPPARCSPPESPGIRASRLPLSMDDEDLPRPIKTS